MPSTMPTVKALAPSADTMNTGSRLWISSDETSISRLTKPSTQMPRGMAGREVTRISPVAYDWIS